MKKADLEKKLSELAALRKIVIAINTDISDLDTVVGVILTKACDLIGATHGSLMLLHPETRSLRIAAAVGADWTAEKKSCVLRPGEGITGKVAATGSPYLCNNTATDPSYFPLFPTVASELAVPVISQGRILGVINIDSDRLEAFTPIHIELLTLLADHAAIAIENSRQFANARATHDQWRQVFDAIPAGVLVCDESLNVVRVNQWLLKRLGREHEQVQGHSAEVVLGHPHPFELPCESWQQLQRNGSLNMVIHPHPPAPTRRVYFEAHRTLLNDKAVFVLFFREADDQR